MNERIKELWKQAGIYDGREGLYWCSQEQLEKFAESIVRKCAKVAWYHTPDSEELEYSHLIKDKILEHFGVEE